jgi:hypothetical protein
VIAVADQEVPPLVGDEQAALDTPEAAPVGVGEHELVHPGARGDHRAGPPARARELAPVRVPDVLDAGHVLPPRRDGSLLVGLHRVRVGGGGRGKGDDDGRGDGECLHPGATLSAPPDASAREHDASQPAKRSGSRANSPAQASVQKK